jgi:hypothetical protein
MDEILSHESVAVNGGDRTGVCWLVLPSRVILACVPVSTRAKSVGPWQMAVSPMLPASGGT